MLTSNQLIMCEKESLVSMILELREENEALNQELNDRVVIEDIAHLFDKDEVGNHFDWEDEIGGMIIDNKKLKEEIEELKASSRHHYAERDHLHDLIGLDVVELDKRHTKEYCFSMKERKRERDRLKSEINKLKAENDKLTNPVINDRDSRCSQFDIRVSHDYITCMLAHYLTDKEREAQDSGNIDEEEQFVYEQLAKTIDNSINECICKPELWDDCPFTHIHEAIGEKVEKLREEGDGALW
jgi:hypothetical protein